MCVSDPNPYLEKGNIRTHILERGRIRSEYPDYTLGSAILELGVMMNLNAEDDEDRYVHVGDSAVGEVGAQADVGNVPKEIVL